jgi:hypothetical protein
MKNILYGIATCVLVAGCSRSFPQDDGEVSSTSEKLDVGKVTSLTRMEGTLTSSDEQARETNTQCPAGSGCVSSYYDDTFTSATGVGNGSISITKTLGSLPAFQSRYGLSHSSTPATGEKVAYYYNRGDLGIGREMHCIDNLDTTQEIACYVKNFAAGDDNSEFTFGESSDIAFTNLHSGHAFATVAMVYRKAVFVPSGFDTVFFLVYNGAGTALLNAATLDRAGIAYENVFKQPPSAARTAALAALGTPGINFNNHIPSNCVTCHGGQKYSTVNYSEAGALFLPFDLDNFDFDSLHPRNSVETQTAFRDLNQIVRRVAVNAQFLSNGNVVNSDVGQSLVTQIDGWYHNSGHSATLTGNFDCDLTSACSKYVPPGWDFAQSSRLNPVTSGANAVYLNVVRGSCRNCHITNNDNPSLHFDTEVQFNTGTLGNPTVIASELKSYAMPHSLQSVRQFWLSSQPSALEAYYRGIGQAAAADTLHQGNAGNVATLDPPAISAMSLGD